VRLERVSLRASPLTREALAAGVGAAFLSTIFLVAVPPGVDFAAHVYQRALFIQHGFSLWNNFWYAGQYSFITYSLLYYPLAAWLGIKLLAVATISMSALAFAVVVLRQWGADARWSSRTFAVVWAGIVLTAAFPFALGTALSLLAIWALQGRRLWRFSLFAVLTLAASPLSFLLLALVLLGIAIGRHTDRRTVVVAGIAVGILGLGEVALWRIFPDNGRYPFSIWELLGAFVFCGFGIVLCWGIDRMGALRFVFPVYAVACTLAFAIPSDLGDNVLRVRYIAFPIGVLLVAMRQWRPRIVCLVGLGLALAWNVSPFVGSVTASSGDPTASAAFWSPAITYLHERALAGVLPAEGGDPARARLVPAARLPAERPPVRTLRAEGVHDLAPSAWRALRRAGEGAARLQLGGGGRPAGERPSPAPHRHGDADADDLRGAEPAPDRDRPRPFPRRLDARGRDERLARETRSVPDRRQLLGLLARLDGMRRVGEGRDDPAHRPEPRLREDDLPRQRRQDADRDGRREADAVLVTEPRLADRRAG
jgi:hypothetical protein